MTNKGTDKTNCFASTVVDGRRESEVYNLATNTWTERTEYYLPLQRGYVDLVMFKGRLLMLGGRHFSPPLSQSTLVFEWDKNNGWIQKNKEMPTGSDDFNGRIVPFIRKYSIPKC